MWVPKLRGSLQTVLWEWLSKDVSNVSIPSNFRNLDSSFKHTLTNIVMLNLNMLGPRVKYQICCKFYSILVVTMYNRRIIDWWINIPNQLTQSNTFLSSKRNGFIFSLSYWKRDIAFEFHSWLVYFVRWIEFKHLS